MTTNEITDGTTTIDLETGIIRVAQDGMQLGMARRRVSELGGGGEWDDVTDSLECAVITTYPSDNPGATYTALIGLLSQAERWARGDPAAVAVRRRVRPAGSRLPPGVALESAVLGGDLDHLAAQYWRWLQSGAVPPAPVTIRRRGAWLNPSYSQVSQAGCANQAVTTLTWGSSVDTWSPYGLVVVPSGGSVGGISEARGRILIGASSSSFAVLNAESMTGTGLSSVAQTYANNGSVLRYTTSSTVPRATSALAIGAGFTAGDVYAVVRAHGSVSYTIQARLVDANGISTWVGPTITIPAQASGLTVHCVWLGRFDSYRPSTQISLVLTALSSSAATLDIDTLIVHRDDGPASRAILTPYAGGGYQTVLRGPAGTGKYTWWTVDNRPLAWPAPRQGMTLSSDPWAGDPILLSGAADEAIEQGDPYLEMRGSSIAVLPLLCGSVWSPTDGSGAATYTITARRYAAYLALE